MCHLEIGGDIMGYQNCAGRKREKMGDEVLRSISPSV